MIKFLSLPFCLFSLISNAQVDVLTHHNDLMRTGWNNAETILTTSNVKLGKFGKIFSHPVDDQIYAQPLIATNITIPSKGIKNVLYIATVNNSLYAIDADNGTEYFKVNLTPLTPAGIRPVQFMDFSNSGCGALNGFTGNIGIIGTPVIDKISKTIYLVARSVHPNPPFVPVYQQYLHALDITNGSEKFGGPVAITAQVLGTGDGAVNGVISFDPWKQNQRPGLLLLNNTVYIGYSSHCDWSPYHGWILGYDAGNLQQKYVFNSTQDGAQGGIWMCGAAPAADAASNSIYLATGNGTVGDGTDPTGGRNRGQSMVKLSLPVSGNTLNVTSYFTPNTFKDNSNSDLDVGVIQVLLIPGTSLALSGCKDGHLYLTNRDNMGGYNAVADNITQDIFLGSTANFKASFGYYKGAANEFVYVWPAQTGLHAMPFNRGTGSFNVGGIITSGIPSPMLQTGAFLSTSSNGSDDATAILWSCHATNCNAEDGDCPGILRAIKAADVTQELWNSNMVPGDFCGNFSKFVPPTIANGKVYVATFSNQVVVYGLLNGNGLPIKLANFTGQNVNDQYISLEWSVAMQTNNNYFEVERSVDGSIFQSIAKIPGDGNSSTTKAYSVNDMKPAAGINIYRLKQIDFDGRFSYSKEILVRFDKQANPLIYPNPAYSSFTVIAGREPMEEIMVYDMLGKEMKKIINPSGTTMINISTSGFKSGIYFIRTKTGSQVFVQKLIKQ